METLTWKIFSIISLVAAFVALIIGVIAIDKTNIAISANNLYYSTKQGGSYPTSCNEYRKMSQKPSSGIYYIRPKTSIFDFPVFCDMSSVGGGWTLVAAIHENNIDGKCTYGDKWSSEQGLQSLDAGTSNWENLNVFGTLETITKDDYKNQAYFAVNASDVMIWHVPNEKPINQFSSSAFLQYYTTTSFLKQHGGNMRSMFKDYYPLKKQVGGLKPLFDRVNASSSAITSKVSNWHQYKYDRKLASYQITDGGKDMYDAGNKISYRINGLNFTRMVYNAPYFLYASGVEIKTASIYPFVAFAWIGEGLGTVKTNVQYFEYQVASNFGADGKGNVTTYPNKVIKLGQMTAQYTAFNVFNANDPSVCEVYFYIGNIAAKMKPKLPTIQRMKWSNTTKSAVNVVRFGNSPRNVLVGYTLLSKQRGARVSTSEIENVLKELMRVAAKFTFVVAIPYHVAPIQYLKGDNTTVKAGIPISQASEVDPGFIQFRAFNSVGLPNAICPAVRVKSNNPEQICVGGINSDTRSVAMCGDYAGWGGKPGTPRNQNSPSATGRSMKYIDSSMLIFTR